MKVSRKMMLIKNLLNIAELKLVGKIEDTDHEQTAQYERDLDMFICDLPKSIKKSNEALEARDYQTLSKTFVEVCVILDKIYADDLAAECRKNIGNIDKMAYEEIERYINNIIETLSMLSIDIQVARYKKTSTEFEKLSASNEVKTILAVDDMPLFLKNLKSMLQDMPYKIVCVASATDALRFIENRQPDLFILDIEMPVMNGYELVDRIRDNGQKAPVIFLTGSTSPEDVKKALDKGASDFIIKTIRREKLLDKIKKYI